MLQLNMFDLVKGFSGVIDMVNTTLANHHQRVAVICGQICSRLGLSPQDHRLAVVSAMFHDLGVITLQDRADSLLFEKDMLSHSVAGCLMLQSCPILADEARVLLYHHSNWQDVQELPEEERRLGRIGNLIHLADSIDMCSRLHPDVSKIVWMVEKGLPRSFEKHSAQAALDFLADPHFWDFLENPAVHLETCPAPKTLKDDEVAVFSLLFSHIIDSKSHFTATHTTGVAWIGRALHQLGGFDESDRSAMFVAGLLHDIGKLGVPTEFLEKPGPLDEYEFKTVSRHADLSLSILGRIPGFEKVAPWGALHHEKLNGKGYPGGLAAGAISPESRLMAVADIMTALTEDRPYRAGLDEDKTMEILNNMVAQGGVDGDLVELLNSHYAEVNDIRKKAQGEARDFFKNLNKEIKTRCELSKSRYQETIGSLLHDN